MDKRASALMNVQPSLFKGEITFPGKETEQGVEIYIRVTSRASQSKVGEVVKNAQGQPQLRIHVSAPPVDNQANQAIIELISKHFKVPKSQIAITGGQTARDKRLMLNGCRLEQLLRAL
jgi:uncharacterized protein